MPLLTCEISRCHSPQPFERRSLDFGLLVQESISAYAVPMLDYQALRWIPWLCTSKSKAAKQMSWLQLRTASTSGWWANSCRLSSPTPWLLRHFPSSEMLSGLLLCSCCNSVSYA